MTIEEAIKDIKENIKPCIGGKSLDMAIEALEKQIPKEVKLVPMEESKLHTWKCPTCGSYEIEKFCQHCGQKINWEVE